MLRGMTGVEPRAVDWLGWAGDEQPRNVQQRSDTKTFLRFLAAVATHGEGYVEVARGDNPFPVLALSAASGHGVIHQFESEEDCYLLGGDGSVPTDELVEVPIVEGSGTFTGDFVLSLDLAVSVVDAFAQGARIARLGDWVAL